ncbi:DUF2795 domain-containing protein [Mycetohabitans sp. B46]|uniref:DUF2795 domain-containing protein n=1 Tax=Mycetohabitans sp. B46 TaxID=2772536 RepID=UPI00307E90F6
MSATDPIDQQISQTLRNVRYPATRDALVAAACSAGASNDVLLALQALPEHDYPDPQSVARWIGSAAGPGLSA